MREHEGPRPRWSASAAPLTEVSLRYRYHPAAREELDACVDWYEERAIVIVAARDYGAKVPPIAFLQ